MLATWFPVDCLLCGDPPRTLCDACLANLPIHPRPVSRPGLLPGFAVADYEGQVQEVAHAFKESGSLFLARAMAAPMASVLSSWLANNPARLDETVALVPAPSRPASTRRRGYVPAEVLAKAVRRSLLTQGHASFTFTGVTFDRLVRDQSRLNALERRANMDGRVHVKSGSEFRLGGSRVILVDDIVTTGSTLRNVALALEESGLKPEIFLSFAETL